MIVSPKPWGAYVATQVRKSLKCALSLLLAASVSDWVSPGGFTNPLVISLSVHTQVPCDSPFKNCVQFSFCLIKPKRMCFQVFRSSLEITSPDAFNLYGFMLVLKAILSPWNSECCLNFTSSLMCNQVCWDRAIGRNCRVGLLSWPLFLPLESTTWKALVLQHRRHHVGVKSLPSLFINNLAKNSKMI